MGILTERACLVTGSSRGIGLGIATALAARGALVMLHGRNISSLRQAAAALPGAPRHCWAVADLVSEDGPGILAQEVSRRFGRLDVLIHCAGILGIRGPLETHPLRVWQEVIQTNLTAPFLLTQALLPMLRKGQHPAVVFISSGVGRQGRGGWGAYAVSKFGIEGLTQVWSDELSMEGIRVNAVNPGGTRTAMRAAAFPHEDPLSLPAPKDIAPLFVWLARPDTWVNGRSLDARAWIGRDPEKPQPEDF